MKLPRLIRIVHGSGRRRFCRDCKKPIVLVLDGTTKRWKPFERTASPIRAEESLNGVLYDVYEPTAFHRCPARKPKPNAKPRPDQDRLWN